MSNDYAVILPLMVTTVTATLIAQQIYPESIYSLKLLRRGLRLRHGRDVDILDSVFVRDVMQPDPATVPQTMSLVAVQDLLVSSHANGAIVLDENARLVGLATLQDLERAMQQDDDWEEVPVGDVMTRTLLVAHPDEPIGVAMQRLAVRDVGRMPVVDRDDKTRLLGVIRRADMARAYQRGILTRTENDERENHRRISRHCGTQLLELNVRAGSTAAGSRVRDLVLPEEVLLTSRLRGTSRQLLHGSDVLEVGDVVLALAGRDQTLTLRALFGD
jgi:CIC family chloride channel protein